MDDRELLLIEIQNLRERLSAAEEALDAIRSGGVDALVVYQEGGEQIYTLNGADEPYRVMVETINEGAAILMQDGMALYANACLAEMLDTPLETILGGTFLYHVSPHDRRAFEALLFHGMREKVKGEMYLQRKDGTLLPVLLSLSPLLTPDLDSICIAITDLTEQKRNIEILAAERMANLIIEQAAEAIVVCDERGKIVRASHTAHQLAGRNPLYHSFEEIYPLQFESSNGVGVNFSPLAVSCGEIFRGVEGRLSRVLDENEDGEDIELLVSASPLTGPRLEVLGCVISMVDISEQNRMKERLEELNRTLEERVRLRTDELEKMNQVLQIEIIERKQIESELAELQRRLIDSIEAERLVLARELHDGPMQELYGIAFNLATFDSDGLDEQNRGELKKFQGRIIEINKILRNITRDLRPPTLSNFGLDKAINEHIHRLKETHPALEIRLSLAPDRKMLEAPVQLSLYRIYQVALSNVLRHSKATRVEVHFNYDAEEIFLEVADNGQGFEVPERWLDFARKGNLGLVGAIERAEAVGGNLEVFSQLGEGTRIRISIPQKMDPVDEIHQ